MNRTLFLLILSASLAAAQAPAAKKSTRKPAAAPASHPASYKDLTFPPLRPVEIPKVEQVTLPNGMRLYLLENHELPVISGYALVRTGNLLDPPDKIGLATLTGMTMRTGESRSRPLRAAATSSASQTTVMLNR